MNGVKYSRADRRIVFRSKPFSFLLSCFSLGGGYVVGLRGRSPTVDNLA